MNNAVLLLAFLLIVLTMLGGPASTTGQVTAVKSQALRTASELSVIDTKVQEEDFIIKLDRVLNNSGTPVLISGNEILLELDFSFLGDTYFARLDDYVKISQLKAYLTINSEVMESDVTPSGFLKYTCRFKIPENTSGNGVIGYKTKNWDKNTQVIVSQENGLNVNTLLNMVGF